MSDAIFIANAKKDQKLFINTIEKYGWKKDPVEPPPAEARGFSLLSVAAVA